MLHYYRGWAAGRESHFGELVVAFVQQRSTVVARRRMSRPMMTSSRRFRLMLKSGGKQDRPF
jgi:hypothetical protein